MIEKDETVHHRFGYTTIAIPLSIRKKILSHDFVYNNTIPMGDIYKCTKCKYLIYLKRYAQNEIKIMFYKPGALERDMIHIRMMYCYDAKMKELL